MDRQNERQRSRSVGAHVRSKSTGSDGPRPRRLSQADFLSRSIQSLTSEIRKSAYIIKCDRYKK